MLLLAFKIHRAQNLSQDFEIPIRLYFKAYQVKKIVKNNYHCCSKGRPGVCQDMLLLL